MDNATKLFTKLCLLNIADNYDITSERETARLFSDVSKDRHRYNTTLKEWMYYDGSRWGTDAEGLHCRTTAKDLVSALRMYTSNQVNETDLKNFHSAVGKLDSYNKREVMIRDSRDLQFLDSSMLDTQDFYFNVLNGVLDLSHDNVTLMSHNPDLLLSKIANVEYNPSAECPRWEKFMDEIMQGDEDKIKYIQKLLGLSLTGDTKEEKCWFVYGATTRNGKSTMIETFLNMIGDYGLTIDPMSLAVKQNADSRTASGDIARLDGARFVNASEPPKSMLLDSARLKTLTGRDAVTARGLYQNEHTFKPKFKLMINTNYLPVVNDSTVFSSGRIEVITFDRHFSPSEQDKTLKDVLLTEKSGILNWCIEGLKLYRSEGLNPPQAVLDAVEQYRKDSDKIQNFLDDEYVKKENSCSSVKQGYEKFTEWCDSCGYGVNSKKSFIEMLKEKRIYKATGTIDGKTVRNVITGYISNDEVFHTLKEESPFGN